MHRTVVRKHRQPSGQALQTTAGQQHIATTTTSSRPTLESSPILPWLSRRTCRQVNASRLGGKSYRSLQSGTKQTCRLRNQPGSRYENPPPPTTHTRTYADTSNLSVVLLREADGFRAHSLNPSCLNCSLPRVKRWQNKCFGASLRILLLCSWMCVSYYSF